METNPETNFLPEGVPTSQLPAVAPRVPGKVQAIGIMTLINGIFNILWALGITSTVVLGTLGIGLLCSPITILPGVLGIFEIVYASKLISNPPKPVNPGKTLAILEIVAILAGNYISLIVGIVALVFYNDNEVEAYFASNPPQVV